MEYYWVSFVLDSAPKPMVHLQNFSDIDEAKAFVRMVDASDDFVIAAPVDERLFA